MKKTILTAIFVLLLGSVCRAEYVPFFNSNCSGGLNTKSSVLALKESETPDCLNIFFNADGSFEKRNGYSAVGSQVNGNTATTATTWYEKKNGNKYLVVIAGDKVKYTTDLSTVSWTDITGGATITAGNYFDCEVMQDVLYMTNGTDPPLKWTGTGDVAAADVPTDLTDAKWVAQFKNYGFYGNVIVDGTAYPSRVYYSAVGDVTDWNANDYIDISFDDGEAIQGMEVLGESLYIFKETKIFSIVFTGDADVPFIYLDTPSSVGSVSGYSIKRAVGMLFFLYWDGIYKFDGNYSTKISGKIDPTIEAFNKSVFSNAHAEIYTKYNHYMIAFDVTGGTNDYLIVYDYMLDAFAPMNDVEVASLCKMYYSGDERIYFGDYASQIYLWDSGSTDDGSDYDSYYWTKWFDLGDLVNNKRLGHLIVYVEDVGTENLNVGYNYNMQSGVWKQLSFEQTNGGSLVGSATVGTSTVGGDSGVTQRLDVVGSGRLFRIKFWNNSGGEDFKVYGYGGLAELGSYR